METRRETTDSVANTRRIVGLRKKMVEPTGQEVVVDERTKALNNYRRKLVECRDIEQKLKDLRKKESELTKQFDKSLQSVGQIVGEVLEQLSEEKFIVKATSGPRYVVGCRRSMNKEELKQGTRVALDMTTLSFRGSLAHKIEKLYFIELKYRALLLFVSSVGVTDAFKKQLEEDRCMCRYDEHNRIVWIRSDCNEISVEGEHRKRTVNRNGRKKNDPRKNDPKTENDDEDSNEANENDDEKEEDENDDGNEDENDETRSPTINRFSKIVVLQTLLKVGFEKQEPIVLSKLWRTMIEQERWKGVCDTYKKHFRGSLAHKIEKLYFIELKYRALLLFVSSVRVTDAFKKKLEEDQCICRYDEHNRIVWIRSDCNEISVEGEHRKRTVKWNGPRKNGPKTEKDDEDNNEEDEDDNGNEDENDDGNEDENDDDNDENEKDDDDRPDDEYMEVDKEEDHLQATPTTMMTVGIMLATLKEQLDECFKEKQLDVSLRLSLKEETELKTLTDHETLIFIQRIAKTVVESENEKTEVFKANKYVILEALDLMAFGLAGCGNSEINRMLRVECNKKESISLDILAELVIALPEE